MEDSGKDEKGAVVVGFVEERTNGEAEEREAEKREAEKKRLLEGVTTLDFDMLCSTVVMQSQGKWRLLENEDDGGVPGVLRMWEGEVLGCSEDRRITIESVCCPCYRFGKNMKRAGLGSCLFQGTIHFVLALAATISACAFVITRKHHFLYLVLAFTTFLGSYSGFLRTQIRKKFNIRGSDNSLDDCVYHLVCPCCSLCQEARTLEMNNVQDGTWQGRGDKVCIGSSRDGYKALYELHPPSPLSMKTSEEIASMPKDSSSKDFKDAS